MSGHYRIDTLQLAQLRTLAKRLYTEDRMGGDEMRNAAQMLDAIFRVCEQLAIHEEPTHPATGEPSNEARAARMHTYLSEYASLHYGDIEGEEIPTIVQDFITDALHWAVYHQQRQDPKHPANPVDIAARAAHMAEHEIADEEKLNGEID